MEDVSLTHAKDHLEELTVKTTAGQRRERRPGRWKGRFTVPQRLFEPLSDEELAWLSGERPK